MSESLPDPLQSLLARKRTTGQTGATQPGAQATTTQPGAHVPGGAGAPDPAHAKLLTLHIAGATARERGLARASAASGRIRATTRGYARLFERLEIGEQVQKRACRQALDALKDWDPSQAEELAGVATGSGLNIPEIMLTVARTEILALAPAANATSTGEAVPGECSTLALQRPGSSLVGQTWDWHAEFAECWHAHYVEPLGEDQSQLAYAGLAEFGMLGKIGLNSAGIGVDLNILRHVDDGTDAPDAKVGVPIHAVLARILAHARTVDEALAIIATARVSASSLITVSSPDRIAMVEITPGGQAVLEPGEPGVTPAGPTTNAADAATGSADATPGATAGVTADQSAAAKYDFTWFCHTNDFQHAEFAAGQAPDDGTSTSAGRFAVLAARTAAGTPAVEPGGNPAAADPAAAAAGGTADPATASPVESSAGTPAASLPDRPDDLLAWLATDPADELISRLPDPAAPLGQRLATLATVRMDPAARTIRISPGIPQAAARATVEFTLEDATR